VLQHRENLSFRRPFPPRCSNVQSLRGIRRDPRRRCPTLVAMPDPSRGGESTIMSSSFSRHSRTTPHFPIRHTEAEWREKLSPDVFHVMRKHGTERAGTSPLENEKRPGTFVCAACHQALFASDAKFDSGTGWPSFFRPLPGAVETTVDRTLFIPRTEVHCSRCGGHLGHVFGDGPAPTGERYCVNGVSMGFKPD
jgi:peptide-methionine (R)-S-oxide reductase